MMLDRLEWRSRQTGRTRRRQGCLGDGTYRLETGHVCAYFKEYIDKVEQDL